MMRLIVLPQALRITLPGIVNTFIGLFKDTTLVLIIGIFDFLNIAAQAAVTDRSGRAGARGLRVLRRRLLPLLLLHVALQHAPGAQAAHRPQAR
jgi:ABC-type amino acid transport system permease subunit